MKGLLVVPEWSSNYKDLRKLVAEDKLTYLGPDSFVIKNEWKTRLNLDTLVEKYGSKAIKIAEKKGKKHNADIVFLDSSVSLYPDTHPLGLKINLAYYEFSQ